MQFFALRHHAGLGSARRRAGPRGDNTGPMALSPPPATCPHPPRHPGAGHGVGAASCHLHPAWLKSVGAPLMGFLQPHEAADATTGGTPGAGTPWGAAATGGDGGGVCVTTVTPSLTKWRLRAGGHPDKGLCGVCGDGDKRGLSSGAVPQPPPHRSPPQCGGPPNAVPKVSGGGISSLPCPLPPPFTLERNEGGMAAPAPATCCGGAKKKASGG